MEERKIFTANRVAGIKTFDVSDMTASFARNNIKNITTKVIFITKIPLPSTREIRHNELSLIVATRSSGGARAVKEPGHFDFRGEKILQPGHPDALFFLKKVDDLPYLVVALKTQAANGRRFTVKIKQIKRSDRARQGEARA